MCIHGTTVMKIKLTKSGCYKHKWGIETHIDYCKAFRHAEQYRLEEDEYSSGPDLKAFRERGGPGSGEWAGVEDNPTSEVYRAPPR